MNYDRLLEHEYYRWSYMTEQQLIKRLGKITNPDKLDCFRDVAFHYDKEWLVDMATERKNELRGGGNNNSSKVIKNYRVVEQKVVLPTCKEELSHLTDDRYLDI